MNKEEKVSEKEILHKILKETENLLRFLDKNVILEYDDSFLCFLIKTENQLHKINKDTSDFLSFT